MYEPWPTCTTNSCAGVRLPGKRRCLAHAEAANRLLALEAITDGDPVDLRGVPLDARLLGQIVDALPVGVGGAKIWEQARFDGARILADEEPLDLSGHEFARSVSWRGARAQRPVLMRRMHAENAVFTGCGFAERLDASDAVFRGPARFDDAEFPGGLDLDGAQFGQLLDLRRTIAADVTLTGASIGTDVDFSLANLVVLDMQQARVERDVVFHAATVTEAAMSGIAIGGQVFGMRARVAGWEPRPRRAVAGAQPTDWRPVPVPADPTVAMAEAPAWRADLLDGQDATAVWWVTVEEWVGASASGPSGGGTIGLQLCPWPTADGAGRPRFDEDSTLVAAVDAEALLGLLAARLGTGHRPRVGTVYAMRLGPLPGDRTLGADELAAVIVGTPVDITAVAREVAHAASMATVMPPLDPRADATLIGALAGGGTT